MGLGCCRKRGHGEAGGGGRWWPQLESCAASTPLPRILLRAPHLCSHTTHTHTSHSLTLTPQAKLYYTLLTYSAEGLVATAAEKPHRFSADEYRALLAANVAGRPVSADQRAALQRVLAEAARGAKPAARAPAAAALQGAFAKAVQGAKSAFKQ